MGHKVPDFAIEAHARMLARRFKHHAKIEAVSHAERLKQQGDHEGHEVWMDVANRLDEIEPSPDHQEKTDFASV